MSETGRVTLEAIATPSDRLAVVDGALVIAGHRAADLLARYGSPLYVTVEATLRENYRRLRRAFAERWGAPVTVMYALKANNALAIRAVLSEEGAGGDCFGVGELHATLTAGTDPRRVVMNGSNKTRAEIDAAVAAGILINIDSTEEIDAIAASAAAAGRIARVNLRLKLLPEDIDRFSGEFFRSSEGMLAAVRKSKWGFTLPLARELVARLLRTPNVELHGYSAHVGRFSNLPEAFAIVCRSFGEAVVELHRQTGFWPSMLDVGGGWPRQREPEARAPQWNSHPIEDYAAAATNALAAALAPAQQPVPELWLEPGRYIVGNAVLMLATVGAIKRDADHVWVHVDACTNHLMRIDTSRAWHRILAANRMDLPQTEQVDVVGSTCIPSVLGADRALPPLSAGDVLAILDAGMYAEAIANQFNGTPRPANVMIGEHDVAVIKRRETLEDLFAHHALPPWLAPARAVP
jgi:diaminopimelate decarboxylase